MTHTPTPWECRDASQDVQIHWPDDRLAIHQQHDAGIIADVLCFVSVEETKANAEFIVRAVNCHDDLLAIVDRVANRGKIDEEWVQAARAAIAKATGV